jgi:hypothetical protein
MADALLSDPERFVTQSREIAKHLFNSLDKRTSPGDLVTCTFSEDDSDNPLWLALLKMDPSDGFVGERQKVDGKWQVILRRVPNVLPSGELQKCAFVLPVALREQRKYDLIVLDQQTARYGIRRLVASFFSNTFLQCKVNLNREDKTIIFVTGSRNWLSQRESEWPEADIRQFHTQLNTTLQNQTIDAAAFANAVIPKSEDQEDYLDYMTDAVGSGKTLEYHRDPATNEWVIQIRTTVWRQK